MEGIGHAAAVALAERGFTVFAGVRNDKDAAAIAALGLPTLLPLTLDVVDPASMAAAAARIAAWQRDTGRTLFALVNNAGISMSAPVEALPLDACVGGGIKRPCRRRH